MSKKRDDYFSSDSYSLKEKTPRSKINKKAQLTIFMILGIIILFIFLFLIQASSQFIIHQLKQGEEDVFSKVFRKEGIRIFVQDCFEDELRNAIILSGKQARIWDDQPGGISHFEPGITGVQYLPDNESRIAYALTNYPYLTHKNAYPCASEDSPPVFCQYFFPNSARFGSVQPWERNMEKDIENYLKVTSLECIDHYLQERVPSATFNPTEFTLDVDMQDEGILVQAHYPLSFSVGNEDFFHLSVFDFFYPTKLRKMLRAVYFFPLEMDFRFVDFPFVESTLTGPTFPYMKPDGTPAVRPTFQSDYNNLEISMKRERISTEGDSFGDTVYTFASPFPHVLDAPDNYTLRYVRQNRAPALDYVHQAECLAGDKPYDYLIVKGDETYGQVNIQLKAKDPDEDIVDEEDITYLFDDLSDSSDSLPDLGDHFTFDRFSNVDGSPISREGTTILADQLLIQQEQMPDIPPGEYSFTAKSTDKYGKEDWQNVRVFVDRPIEPERDLNVGINIPYWFKVGTTLTPKPYLEAMASITAGATAGDTTPESTEDIYFISGEDPFFIEVNTPENSLNPSSISSTVNLVTYTPLSLTGVPLSTPIQIDVPEGRNCLNLPGNSPLGSTTCDLSIYNQPLETWLTTSDSSNPSYRTMTPEFTPPANPKGRLTIGFTAQYCGTSEPITSEREVTVEVKQCLPNINPTHPLAYVPGLSKPYYQWMYNEEGALQYESDRITPKKENINPLATTHACCASDYTFKGVDQSCFTNPEPTCSDIIKGFDPIKFQTGYVLSSAVYNCSGARGNVCGENGVSHADFYEKEGEETLICGEARWGCEVSTPARANKIAQKCAGQEAYSYANIDNDSDKDGFCLGTMGCNDFCGDFGEELVLDSGTPNQVNNLNQEVMTTFKLDNELSAQVHCGCRDEDVTPSQKSCDADFNPANGFEGRCKIVSGRVDCART